MNKSLVLLVLISASLAANEVAYVRTYYNEPKQTNYQENEANRFKNEGDWDRKHGVNIQGDVQQALYPQPAPLQDDPLPGPFEGIFNDPLAPGDTDAIYHENKR